MGAGAPLPVSPSVRPGQAERALGDVVEREMLADRGEVEHDDLAHQPLDVELARIAHAAMRRHRLLAGLEPRLDGEELGGVGLDAAGLAPVVEPGRPHGGEMGRLQRRPGSGERVLDPLIGADRPAEHDALAGIARGPPERVAADPDGPRRRPGCAPG